MPLKLALVLPWRLNSTNTLERLRGKRLMFVGDSINRNQWESLVYILIIVIPERRMKFISKGTITTFLAKASFLTETTFHFISTGWIEIYVTKNLTYGNVLQDYNCTVELFWSPFLVCTNSYKNKKDYLGWNLFNMLNLMIDYYTRKRVKSQKED